MWPAANPPPADSQKPLAVPPESRAGHPESHLPRHSQDDRRLPRSTSPSIRRSVKGRSRRRTAPTHVPFSIRRRESYRPLGGVPSRGEVPADARRPLAVPPESTAGHSASRSRRDTVGEFAAVVEGIDNGAFHATVTVEFGPKHRALMRPFSFASRQRSTPYDVAIDVQSRGRADDSSARMAAASSGLARRSWWMRNAGPAPGSGAISHASR